MLAPVFMFSQTTKPRAITFFSAHVFDADTTIYVPCTYDYRYVLQVEATSLTGTLDGTIKFEHKLSGFSGYDYVTEDTLDSRYTVDNASYNQTFTLDGSKADTLKFTFLHGSISGGTLKAKLKMFENR